MSRQVQVPDELLQGLLGEEEYVAAVHRIRRAVDPEALDEAVADLFHAGLPKIEAEVRARVEEELLGEEALVAACEALGSSVVPHEETMMREALEGALKATRKEPCERCGGSGWIRLNESKYVIGPADVFDCADCEGTGKAREENGAADA